MARKEAKQLGWTKYWFLVAIAILNLSLNKFRTSHS